MTPHAKAGKPRRLMVLDESVIDIPQGLSVASPGRVFPHSVGALRLADFDSAVQRTTCTNVCNKQTRVRAKGYRMAEYVNSPARRAIIEEWDAWALKNPDDAKRLDGMVFFTHLQRNRPDLLLDFKYQGDKWQMVHAWLQSARRVKG